MNPGLGLRKLIADLEPMAEFRPAASEAAVRAAEARLGQSLPTELRAFLLASDGASVAVKLDSGQVIPGALPLVWSLKELLAENERLRARTDSRLARLLFFANAGADGMLFAHPIATRGQVLDQVLVWEPTEQTATLVAESLQDHLERWLTGSLKL